MNILYLSYWGLGEGLTASTVFPHLKILAGFSNIEKVLLVTIERSEKYGNNILPEHKKISHHRLFSGRPLPNMLNKIYDFIDFPKKLSKLCRQENIGKIIARGSPAGALAMKTSRKTGIPFYVESFEPHADYMYESGTWKKYDPRYIFQKKWEKQQLKKATALMPVAENYKRALIEKGVSPGKIDVIPCCVDTDKFAFNKEAREKIRKELGYNDKTVGIYTGKFGGLYYGKEAFEIFEIAFKRFGDNFFLMILTSGEHEWIYRMAENTTIPKDRMHVTFKPYNQVPDYLSSADFGFTLIKPKHSSFYCSPIKNGEYLACGLPILLTEGVGDDSKILLKENCGALFKNNNHKSGITKGLDKIEELLREKDIRKRLKMIAGKYRSFSIAEKVYKKWYPD